MSLFLSFEGVLIFFRPECPSVLIIKSSLASLVSFCCRQMEQLLSAWLSCRLAFMVPRRYSWKKRHRRFWCQPLFFVQRWRCSNMFGLSGRLSLFIFRWRCGPFFMLRSSYRKWRWSILFLWLGRETPWARYGRQGSRMLFLQLWRKLPGALQRWRRRQAVSRISHRPRSLVLWRCCRKVLLRLLQCPPPVIRTRITGKN